MSDWLTFTVVHDFAKGSDIDRQDEVDSGTLPNIPSPYYEGDSFRLVLRCYQDKAADTKIDFGAAATVKLYITRYGVSQTPDELATGVVSESATGEGYDTLTFDVPADATDGYGGEDCLVYAVVEDTNLQRTLAQQLTVTSLTGSGSNNPDADQLPYDPTTDGDWDTVPDDVAEALDELAAQDAKDRLVSPTGTTVAGYIYRNNAGTWELADPDTAACETCELFLALGTSPATNGMRSEAVMTDATWAWSTIGAPLYLDDDGAMTETVPTSTTHAGKVGRIVGWVRSATSIRFSGHIPGTTFEEASS